MSTPPDEKKKPRTCSFCGYAAKDVVALVASALTDAAICEVCAAVSSLIAVRRESGEFFDVLMDQLRPVKGSTLRPPDEHPPAKE